jgi:3-hydroxyacyl-CoA dehydrogenase
MGRAIAAHLANAGLEVLMLDLADAQAEPNDPAARSRIAIESLKALSRDRPSPIYHRQIPSRIVAGNFDDNLDRLADCDWVIEAVVERIDIKTSLFERIAPHLGSRTILSSNTSGIPIADLAATLPDDLRPRFLGTHFFNPPRYMYLLELIAGPQTHPEVMDSIADFGESVLGKGVVRAKDRPNFVANRIGTYGMLQSVRVMLDQGLNPTEVDKLTGPLMGRARSATFRTCDLVGLDTLLHVAENVVLGAPEDPELDTFRPIDVLEKMVEKKLLGTKSGGGFFRKVKGPEGSVIEALDLETFEYVERPKVKFPEVDPVRAIEDLDERLVALAHAKGRGADYCWTVLRDTLRYTAAVAAEIADDVAAIARALRWGFGWERGPFEVWDILGLQWVVDRMQEEGTPAPQWVVDHVASGATSFYGEDEDGAFTLDFDGKSHRPLPPRKGVLYLEESRRGPREIERKAGASLWDLGDGVLGLEFHSKMNAVGGDILQMSVRATELAERDFVGLVVGNHGANFSAGANLALLLMSAAEGEFDEIDLMIRQFQRMTMGFRQCARPVVVAPFALTLGGGAEITLHGDAVVASAELYMGLVEAGVGLIPAGGGTKELYLRMLDRLGPDADPRDAAREAFQTIGLAKVATSAHEAREHGFLRDRDTILLNRDRLLYTAKERVRQLAAAGYEPPAPREEIPVGGDDTMALLQVGLYNFEEAKQISEHDRLIGTKLAQVLSGGAHRPGPSRRRVSEQDLLDLEREAFLSLCGEQKSLLRIQHMLQTGKPLRN